MFAQSPFTVSDSHSHSNSEAMASKRPRTAEAISHYEVDPSKLSLTVNDGKEGRKFVHVVLDDVIPLINLTPTGSLKVVYGFDMTGKMEPRSFNSDAPAKPNESLGLRVAVDNDLAKTLQRMDDRCHELCEEMKGGNMAEEWMHLLSTTKEGHSLTVKLHIGLKGECTAIKFLDSEVKKGEGWDFVKEIDPDGFRYAVVKAAVKPKIWEVAGKCGVSLVVTELFVKPEPKPVKKAIFADDIEW